MPVSAMTAPGGPITPSKRIQSTHAGGKWLFLSDGRDYRLPGGRWERRPGGTLPDRRCGRQNAPER
jgi:hypothetical protein